MAVTPVPRSDATAWNTTDRRWRAAFGPDVIAAAMIVAAARGDRDWQDVLIRAGVVRPVVRRAIAELLAGGRGTPLAAAVDDEVLAHSPVDPGTWTAVAAAVCAYLGLDPTRDLTQRRDRRRR